MGRPMERQGAKGDGPRHALVGSVPPDWIAGTAGDDVMTVHKVRDGRPVCGATGEVDEWRRAITCTACLTTE